MFHPQRGGKRDEAVGTIMTDSPNRWTYGCGEKVMGHLDSKRQVACIFCDLSRAFELVNHQLLLEKLDHYGVTGGFYLTLASFLENRKQLTSVRNAKSSLLPIGDTAVPQGSIMGNNLFLILMNDLTTATKDAEIIMFADDTCAIVTADSYDHLKAKLSAVMRQLSSWFSANGMVLNVDKTNIVHFSLRGAKEHELNVTCNDLVVPQVDQVKYLGFTIDSGLTWSAHIDSLCGRLSSACFALGRLRPSLNSKNVRKAYYGYFNSVMAYGVYLWGTAADRDRVFRAQKRAVRIVAGVVWDHPAKELFKEHKILTLPCLYVLEVAKYVRSKLSEFPTNTDFHNVNTRHRHRLRPPPHRLARCNRCCMNYVGPKIYNALPTRITSAPSLAAFASRLEALLLDMACYTVVEFHDQISRQT